MKLLATLYLGALLGLPAFITALATVAARTPGFALVVFLIGLYLQGKWAMLFIDAMVSDPMKVKSDVV